jgi:hypothetical protein
MGCFGEKGVAIFMFFMSSVYFLLLPLCLCVFTLSCQTLHICLFVAIIKLCSWIGVNHRKNIHWYLINGLLFSCFSFEVDIVLYCTHTSNLIIVVHDTDLCCKFEWLLFFQIIIGVICRVSIVSDIHV